MYICIYVYRRRMALIRRPYAEADSTHQFDSFG